MCGIAGLVSFHGDPGRNRVIATAMTAAMTPRGPDAEGLWCSEVAFIGHRRLAVIDIEGGTQPMIATTAGGASVVLSFSGEIYDFRELRAELRGRGHDFRTRSDTEVVLRAHLEWGAEAACRLNGMFAYAVWDGRTDELTLVRDRLGVKPLYLRRTEDGVLFGSEIKAILAHPDVRPTVDGEGLREAFAWIRTPGHAVWRDVAEVRPGTVVTVNRRGTRTSVYWRLTAAEHPQDTGETVATVNELLTDVVARQLVSDVPRCTLLSGGLDSSLITAMAQRHLGDTERVRSFSVDFAGGEDFVPDRFRADADTPYAWETARHAGTDHTNLVLDTGDLADPAVRRAVVTARDLPSGLGDADNSLYLLFRAIREVSTVALSGESADEVFGGYQWLHDPAAQRCETFPWVEHTHATSPYSGLDVFSAGFRAELDLPSYIAGRYAEARADAPFDITGTDLDSRMRWICHLHLTRYLRVLLDRKDRISMALGLEVRVPFCDHRLVEYVFNTPWSMKTFDGAEKSLLRASGVDLLPDSVLRRRKAPYPTTQDTGYLTALREQARELLLDRGHPVHDMTDESVVTALVKQDSAEIPRLARVGLERWLDFATWLDVYRPSIISS